MIPTKTSLGLSCARKIASVLPLTLKLAIFLCDIPGQAPKSAAKRRNLIIYANIIELAKEQKRQEFVVCKRRELLRIRAYPEPLLAFYFVGFLAAPFYNLMVFCMLETKI